MKGKMMTKKRKRRSSRYDPWDDPLSPPRVDPYKEPKRKRKRRGPYDPYPGWGPPIPEEEFYRQISGGPVAFTRPGGFPPPAAGTTESVERKPPPAKPHPSSKPRTGR